MIEVKLQGETLRKAFDRQNKLFKSIQLVRRRDAEVWRSALIPRDSMVPIVDRQHN